MKTCLDCSRSLRTRLWPYPVRNAGRLLATAALLAIPMAARATPTCTASATVSCFAETGSSVTYTVTTSGTYDFLDYGGQGGNSAGSSGSVGGAGAEIGGSFVLRAGDVLSIFVGASGLNASGGAGGGGGSFVVLSGGPDDASATLIPLLIASGGGGAGGGGIAYHGAGAPGSATGVAANGFGGGTAGTPGTGGNGAGIANAANAGGGGAGLLSNGAANSSGNTTGGKDYANGLGGGTTTNLIGASGGFGGGGGGANAGGGGGGYNGGGGGYNGGGGGGGGSLFDSGFGTQNLAATVSGANTGNGLVVISAATSAPVPEPNTLAIVGMGFAALGSLRWRRRSTAA